METTTYIQRDRQTDRQTDRRYFATSVSKIVGMCSVGNSPVLKTVSKLVFPQAPSPTITNLYLLIPEEEVPSFFFRFCFLFEA